MTPTHVYHGTSAKHLQSIQRFGIQPRGPEPGHWEDYPSIPEHVYLSAAYPFYFAMCAGAGRGPIMVMEVSLDGIIDNLMPDEDWLAQQMIAEEPNFSLKAAQQYAIASIDHHRELWPESLHGIGNVAHYGTISPGHITRLCLFEPEKRPEISMTILDPSISLMNYKFMGWYYRQFVAWMFGDEAELPQLKFTAEGMMPAMEAGDYQQLWKEASRNRDGITVRRADAKTQENSDGSEGPEELPQQVASEEG